jgi:hypothetical protein
MPGGGHPITARFVGASAPPKAGGVTVRSGMMEQMQRMA